MFARAKSLYFLRYTLISEDTTSLAIPFSRQEPQEEMKELSTALLTFPPLSEIGLFNERGMKMRQ
jgi:hypothetical protein